MSDYDITTDENGCIKNGLRADIMRCCMENKNLLAENGSIYVGTGEKIIIGEGTSNRITIAKTAALSPGEYGEVLMVKEGELCYSKLSEMNFHYDANGVVDGSGEHYLGSDGSRPAECSYSLKKNLYTEIFQQFADKKCTISLPVGTKLIHISMTGRSLVGGIIEFGFSSVDLENFESFTMYPTNYYDYLKTNNSPYPSANSNYIYLQASAGENNGTIVFTVKGPGASSAINYNYLILKIF